jgi:hypothetical protein
MRRSSPIWVTGFWVAGALAALTACSSSSSTSLPPLSHSGPGVFRVYAGTSQSVPMTYTSEKLPDGTKIDIGIGPSSVRTVNGKPTAFFGLQYPDEPGNLEYRGFQLSQGQSHVVGGRYRFAVLRIWVTGNEADNAADVQITSVG